MPDTCGNCVSFKPMPRPVTGPCGYDGHCHNGVACLGAVLPTNSTSRCNHFAARSSDDDAYTYDARYEGVSGYIK